MCSSTTTTTMMVLLLVLLSSFSVAGQTTTATVVKPGIEKQWMRKRQRDLQQQRERFRMRVIVEGMRNDPFWETVRSSMQDAADKVGVELQLDLYDNNYNIDPTTNETDKEDATVDFLSRQIVRDIDHVQTLVTSHHPDQPDALIVSIPNAAVQRAVGTLVIETRLKRRRSASSSLLNNNNGDNSAAEEASNDEDETAEFPIFGFHSGASVAMGAMELLGFCAMDNTLAGRTVGEWLLQHNYLFKNNATMLRQQRRRETAARGLFINPDYSNVALEERFLGLQSMLLNIVDMEKMEVNGDNQLEMKAQLERVLFTSGGLGRDCAGYKFIQLGSVDALRPLLQVLEENGCSRSSHPELIVGAFADVLDPNHIKQQYAPNSNNNSNSVVTTTTTIHDSVYDSLLNGDLNFIVSEQIQLQASLPIVMAAVYLKTGGARLHESGESSEGVYLSGPKLITRDDLMKQHVGPSSSSSASSTDAAALSSTTTSQQPIALAVVTHGTTVDVFWDTVYNALSQAATDFGVTLYQERLPPQPSDEELYARMAHQIRQFCSNSTSHPKINGLIVSIPNQLIADALFTEQSSSCRENNIPIIAINAGMELLAGMKNNNQDNLVFIQEYIGQSEFNAGEQAAKRMIRDANVKHGMCLMHASNNSALEARCAGVKHAFQNTTNSGGAKYLYLGSFVVPADDGDEYKRIVERAVLEQGLLKESGDDEIGIDWNGIGVITGGKPQLPHILQVQKDHTSLAIVAFDVSPELFDAVAEKKVLFGIDQNEYLQGYWSVPLLSWFISTNQELVNDFIESGPQFVTKPRLALERPEPIVVRQRHRQKWNWDEENDSFSTAGVVVIVLATIGGLIILTYSIRLWMEYRSHSKY